MLHTAQGRPAENPNTMNTSSYLSFWRKRGPFYFTGVRIERSSGYSASGLNSVILREKRCALRYFFGTLFNLKLQVSFVSTVFRLQYDEHRRPPELSPVVCYEKIVSASYNLHKRGLGRVLA